MCCCAPCVHWRHAKLLDYSWWHQQCTLVLFVRAHFESVTSQRCVQDHLWEELWHSLAKHMVQAFLSVSLVSSLRPGTTVMLAT